MGLFPAGAYTIKKFFESSVTVAEGIDPILADLLFDPQTSGGLLLAIPEPGASELVSAMQEQDLTACVGEENFIDMVPNQSNNYCCCCCGGGGGYLQSGYNAQRLK